jgi:hypothetical protein
VPNVHKSVKWHGVRPIYLERLLENGVDVPEIETRPNVISWFDS